MTIIHILRKIKVYIFVYLLCIMPFNNVLAQEQFEFCNNFIHLISFITGQDEGIEQNLSDNFGWMQDQGYTHLRFFGIYPNGYHTFPSPTLNANGYPTDPYLEMVLAIITDTADQYDIIISFDGLEIIAESNQDTTQTGFGYITEEELADVVQDVLLLGITQISEEQFGGSYMQAIQTVTSQMGAMHETTALLWWQLTAVADEQLGSVFNFYHYNQASIDSMMFPPANLGNLHISAEGAHYYDIPFSVAVGSFGTFIPENWKNALLFAQIQHLPERFSIEEENTNFTIWDPTFNFMDHVGNEVLSFADQSFEERPIVNLILDLSWIYNESYIPVWYSSLVNNPAVANTFTLLGYKVITTVDSVIPDAEIYYIMVAGGANPFLIAPLPDYVLPLLEGPATVFLHPAYGIPDENDAADWIPVREYFGLPSGNTETLYDLIPESVVFDGFTIKWGGVALWVPPMIEYLLSSQINLSVASVVLSGIVYMEEVALIIQNGNKFLINSNVIHLESSYILSDLLNGPLNIPAVADIAITGSKALIFAEYNTEINIDLPWTGITHVIRYDQEGNKIFDANIDLGGNFSETLLRGEMVFLNASTTSITENNQTPASFYLSQNHPNPFNSETTISFTIPGESSIELNTQLLIYSISGRMVKTLVNAMLPEGEHCVSWDGTDENNQPVGSGVYFCQLRSGNGLSESRRMVFLK